MNEIRNNILKHNYCCCVSKNLSGKKQNINMYILQTLYFKLFLRNKIQCICVCVSENYVIQSEKKKLF